MDRSLPTFLIILLYIVLISLRSGKKKKGASSTDGPESAPKSAQAPRQDRPAPTLPSLNRKASRKDDDCDYGEVNHRYSHQSERRVEQLDSYLKAGLIDKKEYAEMLERYTRQDQLYETYNK